VENILCWGATMQELMTKLDTILLRCKAIGITLSIKKFKISKEVTFAGYVVKQGAIRPNPECAIALKEFPRPQNIHELRSFLGLAQQLAGFILTSPTHQNRSATSSRRITNTHGHTTCKTPLVP
jgi:hypothetical protein